MTLPFQGVEVKKVALLNPISAREISMVLGVRVVTLLLLVVVDVVVVVVVGENVSVTKLPLPLPLPLLVVRAPPGTRAVGLRIP